MREERTPAKRRGRIGRELERIDGLLPDIAANRRPANVAPRHDSDRTYTTENPDAAVIPQPSNSRQGSSQYPEYSTWASTTGKPSGPPSRTPMKGTEVVRHHLAESRLLDYQHAARQRVPECDSPKRNQPDDRSPPDCGVTPPGPSQTCGPVPQLQAIPSPV